MLETIREYGLEQLAANGEADEVRDRHAQWYRDLAERSIPKLTGPERGEWIVRLEADYANIRGALAWAEERGDAELMMRLVEGCWRFWEPRGYLAEGGEWVERALRLAGDVPPKLRASVLYGGSVVFYRLGDYASARAGVEESLAISREIGDSAGIATALNGLGNIAYEQGDLAAARAAHEESLTRRRAVAPDSVAVSLTNLAVVFFDLGDDDAARACHEEALALRRAVGDPNGIAFALNGLGQIAARQGDLALAVQRFDEAIVLRREQDTGHLAASLASLAAVIREQGDAARAAELYREALTLRWERGERRGAAAALVGLAEIAMDGGDGELAVKLIGAATAMREEIGTRQSTPDQAREERTLALARQMFGAEQVDVLLAAGREMPATEAVKTAMTFTTNVPALKTEVIPAEAAKLTPREREILKLLADGLQDREIAARLSISPATASRHVNNIYLKLDVNSRTAAAMYAFRHGLV
jgi:DNA-binding NarL/FixJ family response regulator